MKTKKLLAMLFAIPTLFSSLGAAAQETEDTQPSNLPDEYLKNLKNYKFVNKRGMLDLAPNRISWVPDGSQDKDNWEFPTEAERKQLEEMGINFPDFEFIEGGELEEGQKRQQTHTIEHVLYALPGDAVSLYPYYGLEEFKLYHETYIENVSTTGFLDTFSHWYDYRSGGRVVHSSSDGKKYDLLDFPSCRNYIQISDNYGFYGGVYMSPGTMTIPVKEDKKGTVYQVGTTAEYIAAVKKINDAGGKGSIELTADLDFTDIDKVLAEHNYTDAKYVLMLGANNGPLFKGVFNGNGHTIRNLTLSDKEGENIGLIRKADDGAVLCNLVIDSSCTFEGRLSIGLIGMLNQGGLTVRNVVMNGTVRGIDDNVGEQFASAILGRAGHNGADNYLDFEDLYIGATIGQKDKGKRYDTVLCGWFATGSSKTTTTFKNIVFTGTLHGPEPLDKAYYLRRDLQEDKTRYDKDETTHIVEEVHPDYKIIYDNCYGNENTADPAWFTFSDTPLIAGWDSNTNPGTWVIPEPEPEPEPNLGGYLLDNKGHRSWLSGDKTRRMAGTSAVFYFPDNDGVGGEFLTVPNAKDKDGEREQIKEYVIAADFSQTFEPNLTHLNVDAMEINEPLVAFRHIFRIRDGRALADELKYNNREYVRRHQHKVSARVGSNFQIRLDSPLPTAWGTTEGGTSYYYEKSPKSYARIKKYGIRVLDGDTRDFKYDLGDGLPNNDDRFELGADCSMRLATASADKRHSTASLITEDDRRGLYDYHTMLIKPKVNSKAHYIVQVIAKDDEGRVIPSSDGDMVLMEYDITFLPEEGASLITEDELYNTVEGEDNNDKFLHAREEYLKDKYGEPIDNIDFDSFFALNKLEGNDALKNKMISYSVIKHTGTSGDYEYKDFPVFERKSEFDGVRNAMHHSFYKWPITWERSGYSFGYNYRYDYNMYMLATHSENVAYHAKADEWRENEGGENGLYDRRYYRSKRLRKVDPRINLEQGYFYYVNAASDPGVTARLNFNIPCPGSRVVVSAWVAEMSPASVFCDEPANISFNFVAVLNNNERITLHNFVTGYLGDKNIYNGALEKGEKLGQWLNVYYSFVPRLAEFSNEQLKFEDVDHYELELAHNGRSSAGSDYAIDDIRAYVVPPYSEADHEGYACEDSPLDVNVTTSFDTLLEKSGEVEAFKADATKKEVSLYYAFVDKEMLDEGADPEKAFVDAIISGEKKNPYGKISFSNYYGGISDFADAVDADKPEVVFAKNTAYKQLAVSGDRMIKFITTVAAGSLHLGKEYYVVFRAEQSDVPQEGNLAAFFDLAGECSYNCAMVVRPSLKIKLDGVIQPEFDNISVCENQSPVLQVNVWSTDNDPVEIVKNAYFDWFDGSINEFENYRFKDYENSKEIVTTDGTEPEAKTLKRALEVFRFHYSDAEDVVGIKLETSDNEEEKLEQWMLDIISIASARDAKGHQPLWLHQASFVLPPVELPENTSKAKAKVVAIPIIDLYPDGKYSVCPSPTEVGVTISNRTPILKHGVTGIPYPEHLTDVPIRLGLEQLRTLEGSRVTFSRPLDMPVRDAISSDGKERKFDRIVEKRKVNGKEETKEGALILAQTNDPEYRHLGTLDSNNEETGYLLWAGEIEPLNIMGSAVNKNREYYIAKFDDGFNFKEGFFYRFRFSFEEKSDETIGADDQVACKGQDLFTLKIVPQYMMWTGDVNLSWDNDDNWRRVSSDEILKTNSDGESLMFTDGKSNRSRGYAPLSFTNVAIKAPVVDANENVDGENPWLYNAKVRNIEVENPYSPDPKYLWTPDPNPETSSDRIGEPTALIQYDMTGEVVKADNESENAVLRCIPWTANNCSDIHFFPGATIMGQQYLNYSRAWVDVELDHSRWYLLAAPLQDVYAGDFYLPTKTARQETELFQEISFDEGVNNRFAPAVYQRSWDKGETLVYELDDKNAQTSRNVAVKTFWSHVYNDVTEEYGGGTAFSIKTDVSKAESPAEKVLFRLPKADKAYFYYSYSEDGKTTKLESEEASVVSTSDRSYKLNPSSGSLVSTTANKGRYFLVGNPFMTYFDIKKFLTENSDILKPTYWLITETGQIAGSVADGGAFQAIPTSETNNLSDATVLAPMQGFFVEAKEPALSVTLAYNETMMRRYDSNEKVLTETTRSSDVAPYLKITSVSNGNPSSAALLIAEEDETEATVAAFDNRELGILSTVYTARGGEARSINFCSDAEGMEIGVIADEETSTTLHFEGNENFSDMFLLDLEFNSLTPLSEVETIEVQGSVSGRFFLTSGIDENLTLDTLLWTLDGDTFTAKDNADRGELKLTICDAMGRVIDNIATGSNTVSVKLGKGVFVVRIANGNEEKTVKICR